MAQIKIYHKLSILIVINSRLELLVSRKNQRISRLIKSFRLLFDVLHKVFVSVLKVQQAPEERMGPKYHFQLLPVNPLLTWPFLVCFFIISSKCSQFNSAPNCLDIFRICRSVNFLESSEKWSSMSSSDRDSVSGKILYIKTNPMATIMQLNNATPGIDSEISKS